MRRSVVLNLLLLLFLSQLARGLHGSGISKIAKKSLAKQIFKSYLPPAPQPRHLVVATMDGTISLVDTLSSKVVWSYHTGTPIYSSYQAPHYHDGHKHYTAELGDDFYVDCGNDWNLYNHTMQQGKCVKTERLDISEYIGKLPYSLTDRVILGKKDTASFLLDGKTGRVLKTYRMDDLNSTFKVQTAEEKGIVLAKDVAALAEPSDGAAEMPQNLVYIERKDYKLKCISKFGNVLWSVAFAEIDAEFQCLRNDESLGGLPYTINEVSATYMGGLESEMPCRTSSPVIQLRNFTYEELFSRLDSVGGTLYLPATDFKLALGPQDETLLTLPDNSDSNVLSLPPSKTEIPGASNMLIGNVKEMDSHGKRAEASAKDYIPTIILVLVVVLGVAFPYLKRYWLNKQAYEVKVSASASKKKRQKKPGNANTNTYSEKSPTPVLHGHGLGDVNGLPYVEGHGGKSHLTFNHADVCIDGRRIGKLLVSNKEIAKGSNGTVVLEGIYDGRSVAVKRLVRTHHEIARKEIQNLIASDQHPNIVRWYGVEHDQDFVYISLERCAGTLSDLIYTSSGSFGSPVASVDQIPNSVNGYNSRLKFLLKNGKDFELWKGDGYPSSQLLKLMRDVVAGVAHLHELGIIHRDLKPQNVLIVKDKSLRAKLSDMGISKRLPGELSSLTKSTTGSGSSGWQAPEQLRNERQTRAVDLFSLGCVLFFCITAGQHPYGDSFERDINILNNRKDLFLVEVIPEAMDLLSKLLDPNPDMRPKALDVLHHPLFWSSEMRLSFLRDASDRVELENRETVSELLTALENTAPVALNGKWDERMDSAFIDNIGRYRRYKFDSVRDLLRVIRNKLNHYRELPEEIQQILGSVPEGFYNYFLSRFPKLLIEVYKVFCSHCGEEEFFKKYIRSRVI